MSRSKAQQMTGLEYLMALTEGKLDHPSMAHTLGFRLTDVKVGKQIGMADGVMRDSAGKTLAKGTTTCLIFRSSA